MPQSDDENADRLDWAVLLAKWTEFARAAVALPTDGAGRQWRESIAPIITLQAVTLALGEAERLPAPERPVALDRAGILIDRNEEALADIWPDGSPDEVQRLIRDAHRALAAAVRLVQGSGEKSRPD